MTKNKGDADIWGEIIEWGKNEGSKSERRDSDRKDEISGWNRQTEGKRLKVEIG